MDEVVTGGFYSIGAKVLVEQETANYFKAATVPQMCCGEVRVEYLSGKKVWVDVDRLGTEDYTDCVQRTKAATLILSMAKTWSGPSQVLQDTCNNVTALWLAK